MSLNKNYLPLFANFVAAFIFGFSYLFIKTGMRYVEYDAVKFLAFRFSIGFLVLSLLLISGIKKVNYRGKPVYLLFLMGVLNPLISQVLETTATNYAPTSQLGVFFSLIPILVVLLSIPINHELPSRRQVLFMIISVSGILLINLVDGQMENSTPMGIILILSAITVISVHRVFVRRASGQFTAFETIYVTTGMGALGFVISTVISHINRGQLGSFFSGLGTPYFIIPILYMGIASSVIAFLCMTYASGHLPIAVSSSTGVMQAVINVLVGILILKEVFRPIDAIGAGITFLGITGMCLSYNASASNRFGAKQNQPKNI